MLIIDWDMLIDTEDSGSSMKDIFDSDGWNSGSDEICEGASTIIDGTGDFLAAGSKLSTRDGCISMDAGRIIFAVKWFAVMGRGA